jgi:predicted outer membrane repeat protein
MNKTLITIIALTIAGTACVPGHIRTYLDSISPYANGEYAARNISVTVGPTTFTVNFDWPAGYTGPYDIDLAGPSTTPTRRITYTSGSASSAFSGLTALSNYQIRITPVNEDVNFTGLPEVRDVTPGVLYVSASRPDNAGGGANWGAAFKDLDAAIAAAIAGSLQEIRVAQGTYVPLTNQAGLNSGASDSFLRHFLLKPGITIVGGYNPQTNTVTGRSVASGLQAGGDKSCHVFYNSESSTPASIAVLKNFIVRDGSADETSHQSGGGAYLTNTNARFENCVFEANNSITGGSSIYLVAAKFDCNDCIFQDNTGNVAVSITLAETNFARCGFYRNQGSSSGGGVAIVGSTSGGIFQNCIFTGNSAQSGAALYTSSSPTTIQNCTFTNNVATSGNGGAVSGSAGALVIESSIFMGNSAGGNGGALSWTSASNSFTSVIFRNNSAANNGGAISTSNFTSAIKFCLFSQNDATNSYALQVGGATIDNSVFYLNEAQTTKTCSTCIVSSASVTANHCTFIVEKIHDNHSFVYFPGTGRSAYLNMSAFFNYNPGSGPTNVIYSTTNSPTILYTHAFGNIVQNDTSSNLLSPIDSTAFTDLSHPMGGDSEWLTDDDGLRPSSTSPLRDIVATNPAYSIDILQHARGATADAGAYDY